MFVDELQSLFDVASCDALEKMKNEEDKNFLQMQREDVSSSSMAGVDLKTSGIEARREQRRCQAAVLKRRNEERKAQEGVSAPTPSVPVPPRQKTRRLTTTSALQHQHVALAMQLKDPRTSLSLQKSSVPWIE